MKKLPPPRISDKRHPVHKQVLEAYHDERKLGWRHAIQGRISKKWIEAQEIHLEIRQSKMAQQSHTVNRSLWKAMEYLWRARNKMEHGTSEEERSLHKLARMNERLQKAYEKKHKLHFVSRNQLFQVPLVRRQQYTLYKNERWLELVEAVRNNRRREVEKLNESLSTIGHYYDKKPQVTTYIRSTKAAKHEPQEYKQNNISKFYKTTRHESKPRKQQESTPTQIVPKVQIQHQKFKNARITTFFKIKPG